MALRPPAHAADAPGIFIAEADTAWRHEKIRQDRETLEEPDDHVMTRYWAGETRYDLDAEIGGHRARDYLDESMGPWMFVLRRLDSGVMRQIDGRIAAGHSTEGLREACRLGVAEIRGVAHSFRGLRDGRLTSEDLQWLYDCNGLDLTVGAAAYLYSRPLTSAEGKPSGS